MSALFRPRFATGLTLGLVLMLVALAMPHGSDPVAPAERACPAGLVGCGLWLPLESVADAADLRRPTAPLLLRRPMIPETDTYRATTHVRADDEFRLSPAASSPLRHPVVSVWGRRPLRL